MTFQYPPATGRDRTMWGTSPADAAATLVAAGADVLLFFDFMSVPQVGREGGVTIRRSDAEECLFTKVLPNMPTLYATFTGVAVTPQCRLGHPSGGGRRLVDNMVPPRCRLGHPHGVRAPRVLRKLRICETK